MLASLLLPLTLLFAPPPLIDGLRALEAIGCRVEATPEGARVTLSGPALLCEPNVTGYNAATRRAVEQVAAILQALSADWRATVVGHTDNVGPADENERISLRRAEAIRGLLVRLGCDSTRIQAEGRGLREPIADNHLMEGRALNRRIEITIKK